MELSFPKQNFGKERGHCYLDYSTSQNKCDHSKKYMPFTLLLWSKKGSKINQTQEGHNLVALVACSITCRLGAQ